MCTVTIHRSLAGYDVAMSRDEARGRGPEAPPARVVIGRPGPDWAIWPLDTESGGTWIGANSGGLAAMLLNNYRVPARHGACSRGRVVPQLLQETSAARAAQKLEEIVAACHFAPFTIVLVDLGQASRWEWSGDRLEGPWEIPGGWSLVTSSSWRSEEVEAWRHELFASWLRSGPVPGPDDSSVAGFNRICVPGREAWSPLMGREHTATRSIVVLRCSAGGVPHMCWYPVVAPRGQGGEACA